MYEIGVDHWDRGVEIWVWDVVVLVAMMSAKDGKVKLVCKRSLRAVDEEPLVLLCTEPHRLLRKHRWMLDQVDRVDGW